MRDLVIASAKDDDAEAVAQVYALSWPASVEHLVRVDVQKALLEVRGVTFWRAEIARVQGGRGHFLVARLRSRIVGFAGSMSESDGAWELVWLFVRPTLYGRGIGGRLYDKIIADIASARPSERRLWAVPGNRRAENFYVDRGWRPTTSIEDVETSAGAYPLRKWILAP
jgi:GNAT superfamily N-acetyltransferase